MHGGVYSPWQDIATSGRSQDCMQLHNTINPGDEPTKFPTP